MESCGAGQKPFKIRQPILRTLVLFLQLGYSSVQPEKVKEYTDPDDQSYDHGYKV
jgi:hypothetical protein